MRLLLATSNQHKIAEIGSIFALFSRIQVTALPENSIRPPEEPFASFSENACHKARYYGRILKQTTFSEDAGMCVSALNNFPGVKTKDFVQEQAGLKNAFAFLEKKLAQKANYQAYFVCAAALYSPETDSIITAEARVTGRLQFPARGNDGFGFDPIFVPDGHNQTFAELSTGVKNTISHRYRAIKKIIAQLHR